MAQCETRCIYRGRRCGRDWLGEDRGSSLTGTDSQGKSLLYIQWKEADGYDRRCVRGHVPCRTYTEKGKLGIFYVIFAWRTSLNHRQPFCHYAMKVFYLNAPHLQPGLKFRGLGGSNALKTMSCFSRLHMYMYMCIGKFVGYILMVHSLPWDTVFFPSKTDLRR